MKTAYGKFNGFGFWYLCLLVCGNAFVPEVGAAVTFKMPFSNHETLSVQARYTVNGGAQQTYNSGNTIAAGATVDVSIYNTYAFTAGSVIRMYWGSGAYGGPITNLASPASVTVVDGTTTNLFVTTSIPQEWCFAYTVVNATSFPVTYQARVSEVDPGNSDVYVDYLSSFTVQPAAQVTIPIGPFDVPLWVKVQEQSDAMVYLMDGVYGDAGGRELFYQLLTPVNPGWYECSGTPATNQTFHTFGFQPNVADMTGTNNPITFTAAKTTNGLSEGTAQEGFGGLAVVMTEGFTALRGQGAASLAGQSNQLVTLGAIEGHLANISTNSGSTTNRAQEVAHGGIVNTNMGDWASIGHGYGVNGSNALYNLRGTVGSMTNFSGLDGSGHSSEFWLIEMPGLLGGGEVDFNPLSIPLMAAFASWARVLLSWLSCVLFVSYVLRLTQDAIWSQAKFAQGMAPNIGGTVAGFGFQSTLFLHLPIMVIIATVLALIVGIAGTFLSSSGALTGMATNPFASAVPAIAEGMWLLGSFVDFLLLITHVALGLIYRLILSAHGLVAQLVIRAMPGAILLCFLSLENEAAARLEVFNYSAAVVVADAPALGGSYSIPSGGSVLWESVPSDVTFTGVATAVWTNAFVTGDARVKVFLSDTPGDLIISSEVTDTVEQSFHRGLYVGGLLFGFRAAMWVVGLLRPRGQTESVT